MKQKSLPKPRDPFVQHLITKKAGAHVKAKKIQRRDDKVELRKQLSSSYNE